jgi:hypothetical protein
VSVSLISHLKSSCKLLVLVLEYAFAHNTVPFNAHKCLHPPPLRLPCRDKTPAALFFRYNTQLGPPYQVIIDTNFINFSIRNKIDLVKVCGA